MGRWNNNISIMLDLFAIWEKKTTFRYIAFLPRPSFSSFLYTTLGGDEAGVSRYSKLRWSVMVLSKTHTTWVFTVFKHLRSWIWDARETRDTKYFRSTQLTTYKNQSVTLCIFVASSWEGDRENKKNVSIYYYLRKESRDEYYDYSTCDNAWNRD